jgi:hypothetical protein
MRRGEPLRRKTGLKRTPLNKRALLKNNPPFRREEKTLPGATGWTQRVFALYGNLCVVCSKPGRPVRAVQAHHATPKRTIIARGDNELAYDQRNGVPVCKRCHERHETATRRIPRSKLPEGVIRWAYEHDFGWYIDKRDIYPDD